MDWMILECINEGMGTDLKRMVLTLAALKCNAITYTHTPIPGKLPQHILPKGYALVCEGGHSFRLAGFLFFRISIR